jgi:two-component system CheB/CheR fusion protein
LEIVLPAEPVQLEVDPLRLSQALSNLLTNAAKYTDAEGRVRLTVRLLAEQITMSVKDTGIGFAPTALPKLFEMFSQVDSAVDRAEGGLGIGLALVKGLIALHGGTVEAASEGPGLGSEFTIHLPRTAVVTQRPEPRAQMPARRAEGRLFCKVLVADDNRDAADSLALLLEMSGHSVRVAHSGQAALEIGSRERPDAVILDIGMPDVSGYDVARRIRKEPWGRTAFLLAITGWGQENDKERARAAGFDQHLTKPVDPDQVGRLLIEYLERRTADRKSQLV